MERIKRQENDTIQDDDDNNKKQKLKNEITIINTNKSIFEDLANETIYEIFEYLDINDVYEGFSNLNNRFHNLFINSNLPIQVNISTMSKSKFEHYHKNIILPNKHRINILRLSNPFTVHIVLSPPCIISEFIQLKTLILDNIKAKYLKNILKYSIFLPKLHSLIINSIDFIQNPTFFFIRIFRLPKLKYCKIKFQTKTNLELIFISTEIFSPIEYFVINSHFRFGSLNNLLSYLPQLHRLSIDYLDGSYYKDVELTPIVLKYLKYVSIKLHYIRFDRFEKIVKTFFRYVEILRIKTKYDQAYFDAKQWEQLIVSSMPNLRIFDINHDSLVRNNPLSYHDLIDQFNSSYWIEKQWFFTHQHDRKGSLNSGIFYSTNPYRRKDYKFYWEFDREICSHLQENNLKSVKHVKICGKHPTNSCINYFPNAVELTIKNYFRTSDDSMPTSLNRIVPLVQLTKLVIEGEGYDLPFKQLVQLIGFTPNLHTLKLDLLSLDKINLNLLEKNDIFQHVSTINKIKNFEIRNWCTLENIQLIIHLFPQLEYLKTRMNGKEIGQIIRFLLSKTDHKTRRLFFLCFSEVPKICLQELHMVFKSKNLLDNYFIKFIKHDLYLWW